jgi:hypothetical protein
MSFRKQKIILIIFSLGLFFSVTAPLKVQAAGLVPCGGYNTDATRPCTVLDAFVLVAKITNFLIGISGIYAVYVIINNSFGLVVYSMGNEEAITKNKEGITNAIVGMVLVLMAYMIVNTVVNVLLTRDIAVTKNANCKLNLTDPTSYLTIKQNPCSGLPEESIH